VNALLDQISPRSLWLAMGALFGLSLLGSYLYVYRDALGDYLRLRAANAAALVEPGAAAASSGADTIEAELAAAHSRLLARREALLGSGAGLPPEAVVPFVIGELDQLSRRHRVRFDGVTPGELRRVMQFEEQSFEISVRGDYFNLYAWLRDVERALRPMLVKHFELRPLADSDGGVVMRLQVVSYRLPDELSAALTGIAESGAQR